MTAFRMQRRGSTLAGLLLVVAGSAAFAHPVLEEQIHAADAQLAADPAQLETLLQRCDLHRREGNFPAAQADLAAARALAPDHPPLDFYAGRLALSMGEARRAEELFSHYLESQPDHALAWVLLGEARTAAGKPLDAAEAYAAAIDHTERPTPALFALRAQALQSAGPEHLRAAMAVVDTGLQRFPANVVLLEAGLDAALLQAAPVKAEAYLDALPADLRALPRWQQRETRLRELQSGQAGN